MKHHMTSLALGTTLLLALSGCGSSVNAPEDLQVSLGGPSVSNPNLSNPDLSAQAKNCPGNVCPDPDPDPDKPPKPPPPPPPTLPGSGPNIRLKVVIDSVTATDTSEWTDEFYMLGSMVVSKANGLGKAVPLVVPVFNINSGQTHSLNQVILNEVVTPGSNVLGRLVAYEEDFSNDWRSVLGDVYNKCKSPVVVIVGSGPSLAVLDDSIKCLGSVVKGLLAVADPDDKLGTVNVDTTYLKYDMAPKLFRIGNVYHSGFWDSYNYNVGYHIEAERTTSPLTF